jgi:hypothetical protein
MTLAIAAKWAVPPSVSRRRRTSEAQAQLSVELIGMTAAANETLEYMGQISGPDAKPAIVNRQHSVLSHAKETDLFAGDTRLASSSTRVNSKL